MADVRKIYMDACCFIDMVKIKVGKVATQERELDVWHLKRLLEVEPGPGWRLKSPIFVYALPICLAAMVASIFLTGCERGPTETDMAGCALPRNPTWGDVAECKAYRASRHEER